MSKIFIIISVAILSGCATTSQNIKNKKLHKVVVNGNDVILPVGIGNVNHEQLLYFKKWFEDSCRCKLY